MLILTFFVLICTPFFANGQTARDIANNPNNFHMFENFELTKALYVNETKILRKLKELRENLVERKKSVQKLLNLKKPSCDNIDNSDVTEATAAKFPDLLEAMKKIMPVTSFFVDMNDLAQEFPGWNDYQGSMRAIVRLQFAYQMNLSELHENGRIQYNNSDGELISIESFEKLTSIDHAQLAAKATEQKYYNVAIDFAKEALRLQKKEEGVRSMLPAQLESLQKIKKDLIALNNGYLSKRKVPVDREYIVKPYLIDDKLNRKKKQPKFVIERKFEKITNYRDDLAADWLFMETCREGQRTQRNFKTKEVKCRYLHHQDPYMKLGPFKEEQYSERPYSVVFHDILSDLEINYLVEESRPNLSRKRYNSDDIQDAVANHEFTEGKKVKIVHKTVQAWLPEADFKKPEDLRDMNDYEFIPMPNASEITVLRPILWKLAHKIELATQLKTRKMLSATPMQVTNYGLGGLCEQHIDPHGYLEGMHLPRSRESLKFTGDMIGTFMAWLTDVGAGGGTSYTAPGYDGTIMPVKGAASFWYDLTSEGYRDATTQHGGCPVLKGSKWILNKWMYSFDNYEKFPCFLKERLPFAEPAISHYF